MGAHTPRFTRKAWLASGIAVLAILLAGGIALAAAGNGASTPASAGASSASPGHSKGTGQDDESCDRDRHGAVGATPKPSKSARDSEDRVVVPATPSTSPRPSMSQRSHDDVGCAAGNDDDD
jgi:hypothetical protein